MSEKRVGRDQGRVSQDTGKGRKERMNFSDVLFT